MAKQKYYVVWKGHTPGIYSDWAQCQAQINGFAGALYKSFTSEAMAQQQYAAGMPDAATPATTTSAAEPHSRYLAQGYVVLYSDGGAIRNPGPGGYGTVLLWRNHRKELSQGFRLTTNNRMELLGCIVGLESIKNAKQPVIVFSDSKYVVDGINKGWAKRWQRNQWMRNAQEKASNHDLWQRLLTVLDPLQVTFEWVKGHAGYTENERCDELATNAAKSATSQQQVDSFFEQSQV